MIRSLAICTGFLLFSAAPCLSQAKETIAAAVNCPDGCACPGGARICPRNVPQNMLADYTLPPEKLEQFKSLLKELEPVDRSAVATPGK